MTTTAARRLVLEAQIGALRFLRSPDAPTEIAEVAMKEEKRLKLMLDKEDEKARGSEMNAVDDADDAAPMAANFSLNRKPESAEDAAP